MCNSLFFIFWGWCSPHNELYNHIFFPILLKSYHWLSCRIEINERIWVLIVWANDQSQTKNHLLSPTQSGFSGVHGCDIAMVKILDDLRILYDKDELLLLFLLEFYNVFNSVNYILLDSKLTYYFGFCKNDVSLLKIYLLVRAQRMKLDLPWATVLPWSSKISSSLTVM